MLSTSTTMPNASMPRRSGAGLIQASLLWAFCATLVLPVSSPAQSLDDETLEATKHAALMVMTSYSKTKEGDTPFGSGSGYFVNRSGLAITNNHVVDPGHQKSQQEKFALKNSMNRLVWHVIIDSGTEDELKYQAHVLYQNDQADVAVLQVVDEDGEFLETEHYLRFVPSSSVEEGSKAWCFGFPGGDSRKGNTGDHPLVAITSGNIIKMQRTASGRLKMIETDVLANQGNSGGPFVDENGRLIGMLTLGSQTEGRTNTTMLVPADLVHEMISTASRRGKLPGGIDIEPFYNLFASKDRIWYFPMYERSNEADCITLDGGLRVCGDCTDETVTWPTVFGEMALPVSSLAYVIRSEYDDTIRVFLDGGDIIPLADEEASITFKRRGGEPRDFNLEDVSFIAFKKPKKSPTPPSRPAYVIQGDSVCLSLSEVAGDIMFDTDQLGEINIPAEDLVSLQDIEGDRVLTTRTGSRIMGSVADHSLTAKLAWSQTPITFNFGEDILCSIKHVDYTEAVKTGEVDLAATLSTNDPRLTRIAKALDRSDLDAARTDLAIFDKSSAVRSLSPEKKDQLLFLKGEYELRTGNYERAYKAFRKLNKDSTRIADVRWSAAAREALLDRHTGGQFDGQPLSNTMVYELAGNALAKDFKSESKLALESLEGVTADSRSEYARLMKMAGVAEEKLQVAARLTAGESEEYLVRLWRAMANLHRNEIRRMAIERQEVQETLSQGRGGGRRGMPESRRRQLNLRLERFDRDTEKANEQLGILRMKIQDAGFIIDDPDKDN